MTPARGPVFLSIPMEDWKAESDANADLALARRVVLRTAPDPNALRSLATALDRAKSPCLIAGADIDASGGWAHAVALAEKCRLPVWMGPSDGRVGFPHNHPHFRGQLPPAIGAASQALAGHDLALVVGTPVFRYYPYVPGPILPSDTKLVLLTADPAEAARAAAGDAILGDVALGLEQLVTLVAPASRPAPATRPAPPAPGPDESPMSAAAVFATVAKVLPRDAIVVNESPSNLPAFFAFVRPHTPGSFFFSASGGLGFGLAAAVGAQLAAPNRKVLAVIGDGSAQYAITALWSAVEHAVPLTILVMRNSQYGILKWFGGFEHTRRVPGLDLPHIDHVALAQGYGMRARRVTRQDELETALREGLAASAPELIEAVIDSSVPALG
jgi:benzoylformate decarboxylase